MPRLLLLSTSIVVGLAAVALGAGGHSAGAAKRHASTLRFDEKSTLLKVVDNPPADSGENPDSGDTVLVRSDLLSGKTKIGSDQAFCTMLDASKAECAVTLFLAAGHLTAVDSFDFSTKRPQPYALSGGTGIYRDARGQARITQATPTLAHWVVTLAR